MVKDLKKNKKTKISKIIQMTEPELDPSTIAHLKKHPPNIGKNLELMKKVSKYIESLSKPNRIPGRGKDLTERLIAHHKARKVFKITAEHTLAMDEQLISNEQDQDGQKTPTSEHNINIHEEQLMLETLMKEVTSDRNTQIKDMACTVCGSLFDCQCVNSRENEGDESPLTRSEDGAGPSHSNVEPIPITQQLIPPFSILQQSSHQHIEWIIGTLTDIKQDMRVMFQSQQAMASEITSLQLMVSDVLTEIKEKDIKLTTMTDSLLTATTKLTTLTTESEVVIRELKKMASHPTPLQVPGSSRQPIIDPVEKAYEAVKAELNLNHITASVFKEIMKAEDVKAIVRIIIEQYSVQSVPIEVTDMFSERRTRKEGFKRLDAFIEGISGRAPASTRIATVATDKPPLRLGAAFAQFLPKR